jgi:hypothetical protein
MYRMILMYRTVYYQSILLVCARRRHDRKDPFHHRSYAVGPAPT